MYKKLVGYDSVMGLFAEVDPICLKRKAQALKDIISAKIPMDDPYQIHSKLLPILDACLRGEVTKPFKEDNELISGNYLWDAREGFLKPEYESEFDTAFNHFAFTAEGMSIYEPEQIIKDGETYAYMEFEEPGDWPDLVLKLEDQRRREMMGDEYVPVKR
jgi:hypothetical protein